MELNLSKYQKQKLKKAWIDDVGVNIKLNSKHVKKTNIKYYPLFPSLSNRNANKIIERMKKNKGVELVLSEKEVENLVLYALSDTNIKQYIKNLDIPNFRNVYTNLTQLPNKIKPNECGIINLDFHWVCYFKDSNKTYYFDSKGQDAPLEVKNYLGRYVYNKKKIQKESDPAICGHLCLVVLYMLCVKKMKWSDIIKTIGIDVIKNFLYMGKEKKNKI